MNVTTDELNELQETLRQSLTTEQVVFGQAISICSVLIDKGLLRAHLDDVVDGLFERFNGMLSKEHISETAIAAIEYGFENNLFELVDEETFSLTESGRAFGQDWLTNLRQS